MYLLDKVSPQWTQLSLKTRDSKQHSRELVFIPNWLGQDHMNKKVLQVKVVVMVDIKDTYLLPIRLRQIIITSVHSCIVERFHKEEIKMIIEELIR